MYDIHIHQRTGVRARDLGVPVLVLNQNFVPVNVCSARRAVSLVVSGKAEVLETAHGLIRSQSLEMVYPSVIRLHRLVKVPHRRVPLSRREVFARDSWTCQYCGLRTRNLTLDHVVPRSKGGRDTWDNLVSACAECNHRKGSKTLEQVRMTLARRPREPHAGVYSTVYRHVLGSPREEWLPYLPGHLYPVSSAS